MMKKVFIIGGTGFLGYYASLEFIKKNWQVVSLSLPPEPKGARIPSEMIVVLNDYQKMSDKEILKLLDGCSAFVFAAGLDDRYSFKKPAYRKFYEANVKSCIRLIKLAREAGVKRGVILSSYFLYFSRLWPEMELAKYHPYIKSRKFQAVESIKAAGTGLDLMILELPYIFGSMPGRVPLWFPLVKYIKKASTIYYPKGGTNMIAVEHVAEAIVKAIEKGRAGKHYTIGDQNITWVQMIEMILKSLKQKKKIVSVPDFITKLVLYFLKLKQVLKGEEGGLDPLRLAELQTTLTYFDPSISQKELGYTGGDLEKAIDDTVKACLKEINK